MRAKQLHGARVPFFDCNEKPFFWGGPFFRDGKVHLFLKR
jgi:hypothetical protein